MRHEAFAVWKGFVAGIALERLLLGVLPLVHLQLPLADELLAAVVAGVQLLPGVDQFVSGEGYSARVVLIAHIALEPLPCPAIRLHVILQTLPGQELLPAFFTYFTGEILAIVDLLNVSDVAAWGVVDALADLTADIVEVLNVPCEPTLCAGLKGAFRATEPGGGLLFLHVFLRS